MPFLPEIDPKIIDLLIQQEKERLAEVENDTFLQIPAPIMIPEELRPPEKEKNTKQTYFEEEI